MRNSSITPASGQAELNNIVAGVVDQVVRDREELQKIAAKTGPSRAPAVLAVLLGLAFVGTVGWALFRPPPPPPFTAKDDERAMRFELFLSERAVEAFRAVRGRYPTDLAEARAAGGHVKYELQGTGYVLTATLGSRQLTWHSGDDVAPLRAVADSILGGRAR
jgi:hypothetical protein